MSETDKILFEAHKDKRLPILNMTRILTNQESDHTRKEDINGQFCKKHKGKTSKMLSLRKQDV